MVITWKKTFNIALLSTCGFLLQHSSVYAKVVKDSNPVKLVNPIVQILDGKSFGIDGESIGLMLQVRREVRKILFGKPNEEGNLVGMYDFEGALHSAISLAKIESEHTAYCFSKEDSLIHDKSLHTQREFTAIQQEHERQKSEMFNILLRIKDDFKKVTKSYVKGARGFKNQILILIQESCQLRGKKECFLLKWSEAADGQETEAFDKEIVTFEALVTFLTDLTNFLEDMVNSCDKGREQFMAKLQSHKQQPK